MKWNKLPPARFAAMFVVLTMLSHVPHPERTAHGADVAYLSFDTFERVTTTIEDWKPSTHIDRLDLRNKGELEPKRSSFSLTYKSHPETFRLFPSVATKSKGIVWGLTLAEFHVGNNARHPEYKLFRHELSFDETSSRTGPESDHRVERWEPLDPNFGKNLGELQRLGAGSGYDCVDVTAAGYGEHFLLYDLRDGRTGQAAKKAQASLRPIDSGKCRLFAICEPSDIAWELWPKHSDRRLFVFDFEMRAGPFPKENNKTLREPDFEWRCVWTRVGSMSSPVVGSFDTVASNDGDYLIVGDGSLYFADWKRKADSLRPIRLRDGELVQALIYDLDRGRTAFAFTSRYRFQVEEPFEYHDFDIGSLKPEDTQSTLIRCAREVRRAFPALHGKSAE